MFFALLNNTNPIVIYCLAFLELISNAWLDPPRSSALPGTVSNATFENISSISFNENLLAWVFNIEIFVWLRVWTVLHAKLNRLSIVAKT